MKKIRRRMVHRCVFFPGCFIRLGSHADPGADSPTLTAEHSSWSQCTSTSALVPPPTTSAAPAASNIVPPRGDSPPLVADIEPHVDQAVPLAIEPAGTVADSAAVAASATALAPVLIPSDRSSTEPSFATSIKRPVTRLQHWIRKPKVFTDGTVPYGNLAVVEATNLRDALMIIRKMLWMLNFQPCGSC